MQGSITSSESIKGIYMGIFNIWLSSVVVIIVFADVEITHLCTKILYISLYFRTDFKWDVCLGKTIYLFKLNRK